MWGLTADSIVQLILRESYITYSDSGSTWNLFQSPTVYLRPSVSFCTLSTYSLKRSDPNGSHLYVIIFLTHTYTCPAPTDMHSKQLNSLHRTFADVSTHRIAMFFASRPYSGNDVQSSIIINESDQKWKLVIQLCLHELSLVRDSQEAQVNWTVVSSRPARVTRKPCRLVCGKLLSMEHEHRVTDSLHLAQCHLNSDKQVLVVFSQAQLGCTVLKASGNR